MCSFPFISKEQGGKNLLRMPLIDIFIKEHKWIMYPDI